MASRRRPRGLQTSCRSLGARSGGSLLRTAHGHRSAWPASGTWQPQSPVGLIMLLRTARADWPCDPEESVMLQAVLLHGSGRACCIIYS